MILLDRKNRRLAAQPLREPPRALFRLLVLPDYFRVGFAYSRVYVCLSAASTAGGPGPGPYSQGRRETPEENRPAMRAIIPQPMSPPLDLYSSPSAVAAYERIPGLFALFDKGACEEAPTLKRRRRCNGCRNIESGAVASYPRSGARISRCQPAIQSNSIPTRRNIAVGRSRRARNHDYGRPRSCATQSVRRVTPIRRFPGIKTRNDRKIDRFRRNFCSGKVKESPGCSSRRRIRWSDRWTPTRDTRIPPEAGHPLSDCPTATGVRQTGRGEPTPAAPPSCDLSYMPTAGSHVFRGSHVASGSRVFRGTHVFRIEQTQPEVPPVTIG
ncbi:hypothetical protein LSAT2_026350 [Lamellibrachia satsuma]|nr:hypothetical protein LSAT2_026350 [Lamellibrachia satsuma]